MTRPLRKELNFSYTVEELELLKDIYINSMNDLYDDESYGTDKSIGSPFIEQFTDWLLSEDRRPLLK